MQQRDIKEIAAQANWMTGKAEKRLIILYCIS
jgi:hypothetical protein